MRRVRCAQHIAAGRGVLHLEADGEVGVGADLVVHDARRVLGGQHQIDAQRTADGGRADQRLHELRLLTAQFAEFVRNDDQTGQTLWILSCMIAAVVVTVFHDAVFGKKLLPTKQLAVQRDHRALDIRADIRDFSDHVRQSFQCVGQSTALIVDHNKRKVIRVIVYCERQQPSCQQFTLAGTRCTRNQPVRAVVKNINVERLSTRHHADGNAHALFFFRPAVPCVQLLHRVHVHTL